MIKVKSNNLNTYLAVGKDVIVMFGSPNCGVCRKTLNGVIPILEEDYPDITFMYVDADRFERMLDKFKIEYYPTFIKFVFGKPQYRVVSGEMKKIKKGLNL